MKRILTAMGNVTLNNELKRYSEYEVNEQDLFYQDAVIDLITEEEYDVLIVSALLQGQSEFPDFLEKVRGLNNQIRIIVVTDEITTELKMKLNEEKIIDVFKDSDVEIKDIIDSINREEPLRKRCAIVKEDEKKYFLSSQACSEIPKAPIFSNKKVQKQEVIVISGINGAGKSTIACNLSKVLSTKTSARVLLIDMDTLSGNMDEILEINKIPQNVKIAIDENKKCGLNYAAELINKNRFDANVFEELVINVGNVDVLTGNTSLHYCQNVLNEKHYNAILECAKEKYDFVIIDTSSNIFLDSTKWALKQANRIMFIVENNYISMKKATQLINVVTSLWGVWKEKIEIIVNKESVRGIESEVVKKILEGYELIGRIKYGEENVEVSYLKILGTINYIPKVSILTRLFANKHREVIESNRVPLSRKVGVINAN